jgi:CheY-like chemotaxis protein
MKISKERIQETNLNMMIVQFRNEGRAKVAADSLKEDKANPEFLKEILRDHRRKPITKQEEIIYRDNVDFLLKFYSLLELGILTRYINPELFPDLRSEIIEILELEPLRKYYEEYYPLILPQLLLQHTKRPGTDEFAADDNVLSDIIALDTLLDDDVETFQWMLDSGRIDGYSIKDLNALLKSKDRISDLLEKQREQEDSLDKSFWGFLKFSDYMVRYARLMQKCKDSIIRSSIWHYQSYWFKSMKTLMHEQYARAIQDIKDLNSNISFEEYLQMNPAEGIDSMEMMRNYRKWKEGTDKEMEATLQAVGYLLEREHEDALVLYLKTVKQERIEAKINVLVISDEVNVREVTALELSKSGLNGIFAESANEALDIVEFQIPDVILLDVHMPNMDGPAFLKKLNYMCQPTMPKVIQFERHHFKNLSKSKLAMFDFEDGKFIWRMPKGFDEL